LCPPLALAMVDRVGAAIINGIFWLPFFLLSFFGFGLFLIWMPIVHAVAVVSSVQSQRRMDELAAKLGAPATVKRRSVGNQILWPVFYVFAAIIGLVVLASVMRPA
jgi:hypothetical protein